MPRLQGIRDFDRPSPTEKVEAVLVDHFNWGVVQARGFVDAPVLTPGVPDPYSDCDLEPVDREGYASGTVWKSRGPRWCFERGLLDGVAPLVPEGVYVDGVFHATADSGGAPFAHRLDFVRGLAVFENPLLPNSLVQVAHSRRRLTFVRSTEPWTRRVFLDGWAWEEQGGDSAELLIEAAVETPAVIVQAGEARVDRGYAIGSVARWKRPVVLFHVLAANPEDMARACDLVLDQFGARVPAYDLHARRVAGDFPLDALGSPVPGASTHAEALALYPDDEILVQNTSQIVQPPRQTLHVATCRMTLDQIYDRV